MAVQVANLKALLAHLSFLESNSILSYDYGHGVCLSVNFAKQLFEYPDKLVIHERQTCNFSASENMVVFECVHQLLKKGYKPEHIELEPKWKLGHGASGGRADILVKDQKGLPLLIIECKTFGKEFEKEWKNTLDHGGQLFSYAQQASQVRFLCLYASQFELENKEIARQYHVISHQDNEAVLDQNDKLKAFSQANDIEERFKVWQQTYELESTESGIFEENIAAYSIGKNKYTLAFDTRPVTAQDKDGKYHDFRTILRQHSIARRETAFEVLVNLFLAKIVDEEQNKDDLDFYWKGIANDNYYDFVDRLQKLYQIGMKKLLNEEVMYISSQQIDDAFWTVKNQRNATKKQIQQYFRDLKFYSNNAFSLMNVHNEKYFKKNTKVLIEITKMWQGLRLRTKEQNQFLGDLFEYFLDNSIKQSEGQFFTPLPITKFITSALPLEQKIKEKAEPLKAIDFACGSGHFLTEYAHQIKPFVDKHKESGIESYYESVVGIEKEDRLAKVAKVSAHMYGQSQIQVYDQDALDHIDGVDLGSFDVLLANPPFAVEGFLQTLDSEQRKQYQLFDTAGLNTNNIQCFFIERAKQLMAPQGVLGVIVPSSILSNTDATHIATREIILQHFDIVALVELGKETFGKTGTTTVVLFLRRKRTEPAPAEHYKNRVSDYFEAVSDESNQDCYEDGYFIEHYCDYAGLPVSDYKQFLTASANQLETLCDLLATDLFTAYKSDFDSATKTKDLKKKKFFKDATPAERKQLLDQHWLTYLQAIEKDKLFYFMLTHENNQKTLVIKSPSKGKEQKQFLGYEWSNAKGSEGIKYLNGGSSLQDIVTPLFDPKHVTNEHKLNSLIRNHFLNLPENDLSDFEEYKDLISYMPTSDLLDFSRVTFNKAFSLTSKKRLVIDSKWDLVKLGDITEILSGGTPSTEVKEYWGDDIPWVTLLDTKQKFLYQTNRKLTKLGLQKSSAKVLPIDTVVFSSRATIGRVAITKVEACTNQGYKNFICDKEKVLPSFLYEVLQRYSKHIEALASGMTYKEISKLEISNFQIPLPPLDVQKKIVAECDEIDVACEQARKLIESEKEKLEQTYHNTYKKSAESFNLSDAKHFELCIGKRVVSGDAEIGETPIYSANVFQAFGMTNKVFFENFDTPSVLWGIDGDWMVNCIDENQPFYPTDHCGVIRVVSSDINPYYLAWVLRKEGARERFSRNHRASVARIKGISIKAPDRKVQNQAVFQVKKLEQQIQSAQSILDQSAEKKKAILDKYLK